MLALPVGASGSPIVPQLTANVTATSITLVGANGKRVRVLQPNLYKIVVRDPDGEAELPPRRPEGEPADEDRREDDRVTWSLYLQPGSYSYRSDRNTRLSGAFIVAGSPPA